MEEAVDFATNDDGPSLAKAQMALEAYRNGLIDRDEMRSIILPLFGLPKADG